MILAKIMVNLNTLKKSNMLYISSTTMTFILQRYDWQRNVFDHPVKYYIKTYKNIRKINTGNEEYYILLVRRKIIQPAACWITDISSESTRWLPKIWVNKKHQEASKSHNANKFHKKFRSWWQETIMFFLFEEIRETFLGFSQGNVRVLKTRSAIFGGY